MFHVDIIPSGDPCDCFYLDINALNRVVCSYSTCIQFWVDLCQ